ncbi:MAG: flagellar basal body L-ring protein FlgH [Candidatus Pacebacteria bacterium]|nr:flagellar basal body L-ring protein FlgH [Candidatus Paceibacterota bacterium]
MNKPTKFFIAVLWIALGTISASPLYSLYTAHRAMRVDDVVTVLVTESAKAGSQSGTNASKSNDVNVNGVKGTGLLGFFPAFGASAGNKINYDGQGSTSRQGSLDAQITARVIKVLDNGNLVIDGSKTVEINEEKEVIKVSGIVRPQDIGPTNIVYSYNIADAQITYSGKGTVKNAERPGIIAKFFNWLF